MEIERLARIASEARKATKQWITVRKWADTVQIAHGRCGIGTKRRKRKTPSPRGRFRLLRYHTGEIAIPGNTVGRCLRLAYRTRSRCNCWHFRVPSLGSRDEESRRRMAGTTLCKTWTAFEPIHFATEKILASASMGSHLSIIDRRSRSLSSLFLLLFFFNFPTNFYTCDR